MFEAPWALLALLSLPILIWIHRRRQQGVPVDVPSLLFLEPEDALATAPDRRRFDAELALTLTAAACLALAAAGPRVAVGAPAPRVRVVLDASPAMEAKATPTSKSPREQAEAALASLGLSGSIVRARGKPTDLVAAARREPADVRIVVSDRAITPAPPDVHVTAYGDPAAENVGIVAVHLERGGPEYMTGHAVVWNHSRVSKTVRLGDRDLEIPADSAHSGSFSMPSRLPGGSLAVLVGTPDALAADDVVAFSGSLLRVELSADLPAGHREAVDQVLTSILGKHGFVLTDVAPEVRVAPAGSPVRLDGDAVNVQLTVLRPEDARVPVSPTAEDGDSVLRGVDATGCECLGQRSSIGSRRPLVERGRWQKHQERLPRVYDWVADPLAGSPAPVDSPAWPVFWANLVESLRGDDVGGGWRARGVLDPDVTRLGRDRIPIDPAWVAAAKPAAPEPKDLRLPLVIGGALCLLLLWFAPRGRRVATVG